MIPAPGKGVSVGPPYLDSGRVEGRIALASGVDEMVQRGSKTPPRRLAGWTACWRPRLFGTYQRTVQRLVYHLPATVAHDLESGQPHTLPRFQSGVRPSARGRRPARGLRFRRGGDALVPFAQHRRVGVWTLGVHWLLKLAVSSNNPADCTHDWAPAPLGWECYRCGRTSANPPS